MLWTRPLQRALIQLPAVGMRSQRIALARVAWALHLTLNVDMDLRRIVPLVLRTTGNDYYIRHTDQIVNTSPPANRCTSPLPAATHSRPNSSMPWPSPKKAAGSSNRWSDSPTATKKKPKPP